MMGAMTDERGTARVVVVGLASCFGCQLQVTNMERHLLDVLGQVDLRYWQLTSSDPMPEEFDVAVVEGAVTTDEAAETLRAVRATASTVIAIGACAVTGGIPGMAAPGFDERADAVYGERAPEACGALRAPAPVSSVIAVDHEVRCCPIDPLDFVDTLQRVLRGSNKALPTATLCGECKRNERGCFFGRERLCLGLVTRAGCGARCPDLGRPCNGCAGLSPDANVASARRVAARSNVDPARLDEALGLFNTVDPALAPEG
ncbi:MAG: NADH:ubiquinone oxidoreductase [Eggerthellaceae bacterium]|nr:NADH:ubiquinone oxidoreductase [Eggerthellaceae bacterium]